jgi:hypothetical protein
MALLCGEPGRTIPRVHDEIVLLQRTIESGIRGLEQPDSRNLRGAGEMHRTRVSRNKHASGGDGGRQIAHRLQMQGREAYIGGFCGRRRQKLDRHRVGLQLQERFPEGQPPVTLQRLGARAVREKAKRVPGRADGRVPALQRFHNRCTTGLDFSRLQVQREANVVCIEGYAENVAQQYAGMAP